MNLKKKSNYILSFFKFLIIKKLIKAWILVIKLFFLFKKLSNITIIRKSNEEMLINRLKYYVNDVVYDCFLKSFCCFNLLILKWTIIKIQNY